MDNRWVYRTIRMAMKQLFPTEPKGNFARMLTTLAAMVAGIACKTPALAKADSRIKRYSRWVQNERIEYEGYYLPFVSELLAHLAAVRELAFVIDGSEVGHECITLMISLIYGKRALGWSSKGAKDIWRSRCTWIYWPNCRKSCPKTVKWCFWEMENLIGSTFRRLCKPKAGATCVGPPRIPSFSKRNTSFRLMSCVSRWKTKFAFRKFGLLRRGYSPVTVIARWERGFKHPIYLVTNFELPDEAVYWYKKRFQIEPFFSDEKSRGFFLHKSHLSDPKRLSNLMIAACLAYLWIVYLGCVAVREDWVKTIDRPDRCDWSLFRLCLALLDHFLNELIPIPVSFNLLEKNCVR